MKDHIGEIGYGTMGFVVTYAVNHVWQDAILSIIVASVGATVTALIQHYLKRFLQRRDDKKSKYKENGRHLN